MIDRYSIAGYVRISVDDELDKDNISIEHQRAIINDYVTQHFPHSTLSFFEDRDRSGYTFEQREGYQAMRKGLMSHQYDILIIKDFSRFSRRNGRGLVELEDLRDAGVRIISIGDGVDFPSCDDWIKIQLHFFVNEMPITETSKKVKNVIKRRQAEGNWICAAPYGYIVNKHKEFEVVPTEADIVRRIYDLYNNDGWGYKKIANYLTDLGIPTPRMSEQLRKGAEGKATNIQAKPAWSIVTIQGILDNDFYIGTFRQAKYTRAKINGADLKRDESEHIVIENHHQPIIDYRTFALTKSLREKRTRSHYRGMKKYDNFYSGFLVCGDCGSPMFSMSRPDLKPAYKCGTYHNQGKKRCTSHHIRVDVLDNLLKLFIKRVMTSSADMIEQLNEDLLKETDDIAETEQSADNLAGILDSLREELKATKRQRIRDIMRHPEQEDLLADTYDELESDLQKKIEGIGHQIDLLTDKRNTIIRVNRAAKTAIDIFNDILNKEKLDRTDIELLVDQIIVYEDYIRIKLKPDIDDLLNCQTPDDALNFNHGIGDNSRPRIVQKATNQLDKVFDVSVISNGSPSLILRVLLISLGITTLPSSSILRTMPVAFMVPPVVNIALSS